MLLGPRLLPFLQVVQDAQQVEAHVVLLRAIYEGRTLSACAPLYLDPRSQRGARLQQLLQVFLHGLLRVDLLRDALEPAASIAEAVDIWGRVHIQKEKRWDSIQETLLNAVASCVLSRRRDIATQGGEALLRARRAALEARAAACERGTSIHQSSVGDIAADKARYDAHLPSLVIEVEQLRRFCGEQPGEVEAPELRLGSAELGALLHALLLKYGGSEDRLRRALLDEKHVLVEKYIGLLRNPGGVVHSLGLVPARNSNVSTYVLH